MVDYFFVLLSLCVGIHGQVLFTPPLPNNAVSTANPNCVDKIDNCKSYPKSACTQYAAWAKQNCQSYCFCNAAPLTTVEVCADKITDCVRYRKTVCTDPKYTGWVTNNCKYFCRQCSERALAIADSLTTTPTTPPTTTVAPINCTDKIDCRNFGKSSCAGAFKDWAWDYCKNYCGFCIGVSTPPPPCVDVLPNCHRYSKTSCTSDKQWANTYCKKYCSLCGTGTAVPVVPSN